MARKTVGFAGKVKGKDHVEVKFVKYVKSERSEKTGYWRFNETMVRLVGGETLDAALKRQESESLAMDIDMSLFDEKVEEEKPVAEEVVEKPEATAQPDTTEAVAEPESDGEAEAVETENPAEEKPEEVKAESPTEDKPEA